MDAGFETNFLDWQISLQKKIDYWGEKAGPKVIFDEAGQVCRTLIELTSPQNRTKTRQSIEAKVSSKFATLGADNPSEHETPQQGTHWYGFYPTAVFGVAEDKDMRGASIDDLYQAFLKTRVNRLGRIIGRKRGKQTYYIWQKILTKVASVKQLIKRLQDHIGRQKAGWAISWRDDLGSPIGTLGPPPDWVMKHAVRGKARGFSINGLGIKGMPTFTLVNNALGITRKKGLVSAAFRIRAGALSKDLVLYIRGVKQAA